MDIHLIDGLKHIGQPGLSLLLSNFEAQMCFAQTQRPATRRILTWPTEELDEEGSQRFDRAALEGWWIQRPQDRVVFNVSIKGHYEPSAGIHPTKRVIQIDALHIGCRGRKNRLWIHRCRSSFRFTERSSDFIVSNDED